MEHVVRDRLAVRIRLHAAREAPRVPVRLVGAALGAHRTAFARLALVPVFVPGPLHVGNGNVPASYTSWPPRVRATSHNTWASLFPGAKRCVTDQPSTVRRSAISRRWHRHQSVSAHMNTVRDRRAIETRRS